MARRRHYRRSSFTFDTTAKIYRPRCRFNLSHELITTMNVGTLYPVDIQEVYPGDEFIDRDFMVSRLISSYLRPTMGNLMMDIHVFFVPMRLVYDDWVKVFGNAAPSQYSSPVYANVPLLSDNASRAPLAVSTGTIADYLYGIPQGAYSASDLAVSVLPARAFALIYEEWYRDQNNVNPMQVQKGATAASEYVNNHEWGPSNYFGKLPKVRKIHDYFTSCLPAPQKGAAVDTGLFSMKDAPVVPVFEESEPKYTMDYHATGDKAVVSNADGNDQITPVPGSTLPLGITSDGDRSSLSYGPYLSSNPQYDDFGYFSNLWALNTATNPPTGFTVNDMRAAFQAQRILERDARTGSRYAEYIRATFGVQPSDARLQRPEYIAGWRQPLFVQQVAQTSEGTEGSPLASLAAFGQSNGKGRWHKAFDEHGYVITCASIRQLHVYQQGVERFFFRHSREDFYDPEYAHLGEQPVYKRELYFGGTHSDDVFGYQEIYADLRYRPSKVSGQARSGAKLPAGGDSELDIWHFGDYYSEAPTLGEDFIQETPEYVDRDISVPSTSQDQFLVNFYFKRDAIRPLPARGTPGLIDHTYGVIGR